MTRCDNTENHQPNYVFKKHTYILNSLYLKIEIYFNNAKALAVFTFTATIAPVASKSNLTVVEMIGMSNTKMTALARS